MIAIIPARGGSKGLLRKNVRILGGKPLIQWTVEAASKSRYISQIILSTEDDKIADICRPLGVEIPFMRPSKLAQDKSLAIDTYTYTMDRLINEFGYIGDEFVVLLPTSPFRNTEDIDMAIGTFYDNNADSVISCCTVEHPVEWLFNIDRYGKIEKNNVKSNQMNRQDYPLNYIPNGAIYVLKNSLLKKFHTYYFKKTFAHIMPKERSLDIDTAFDFRIADCLINKIEGLKND